MIFKRLTVAVAALFVLASQAFAAGTIPFSLSQQFDQYGKPLAGCKFYTIQAGTTSTPQNAYQDSGLTIPLPNPQTCDAAGRLPQMFFADGQIKVRLTDKNGVTQIVADGIQVVGASSGSGGGGSVDATTILATGDVKAKYGTGTLSGFVRMNGRTIGSSTSGATERANADTQELFEYLWGADANLTVSGGRGASAAADWTANKTIKLPDARGMTLAGLDDMGNSDATRLAFAFGSLNKTLGASTNADHETLTTAMLPVTSLTFTGTNDAVSVTSDNGTLIAGGTHTAGLQSGGSTVTVLDSGSIATRPTATGSFTPRGSISSFGSGQPHSTTQPTLLLTFYLKL
jgi:microcystin-dependent protein